MKKLGMNRDNQKKMNRGLVLKLIATRQCSSRAEISRMTGLTKPAITQIVNSLIERDYLIEVEKDNTVEIGRNPVRLGISSKAPLYVGLLIQRGYCEAVLCDMQLNIIDYQVEKKAWKTAEELLESVCHVMDLIVKNEVAIAGIGVASIGPVRINEGMIGEPLYFNGIKNIKIRDFLKERYRLPVFFDHDNQSAVLAEHLYGNGRGYQDILLVTVGMGVGCGILVSGRRIHSFNGYAPEIGHISIDYAGKPCICGNLGCLERYINSYVVLKKCKEVTKMDLTYEEMCQKTDCPEIDHIMRDIIHKLAAGIVSTLNVLNSQIVLLAMDCVLWPDEYIQDLQDIINRKKFGNFNQLIEVKKCYFRSKTQVLGAACNAISQTFQGNFI